MHETMFTDAQALSASRIAGAEQPDVTRKTVQDAVKYAQNRLLAAQNAAGFYLYKYNPFEGLSVPEPVSLVRQAGCAYALAWASERARDEAHAQALATSAHRAVTFLLSFATPFPNGGVFLREPDQELIPHGKLGSSALTLLALQYGTLSRRYIERRHELVTAILGLQEANGAFRCATDRAITDHNDPKQNFYPGEALLALCHEARRGTEECFETVERAFPWYREHFKRAPATAFVLWQVDAWELFFDWCKRTGKRSMANLRIYADFVFEMTDWLLRLQLGNSAPHPGFIGGFALSGQQPTVSSATYTEAVIRAYNVASHLGEGERMERYRRAALAGIGFLFRLQLTAAMAALFRDPELAVGGTTRGLADFTIRCDYDQHAITAFQAALESPGLLDGC